MRHVIERHRGAGEDREYGQPREQAPLAQSAWRGEQADERQAQGQCGCVHEGVTPAESGSVVVGKGAGHGVRDGVEHQRDKERQPGERARHPQDLVVVEEDKCAEGGVFQALGELSDAERQFARKRDQAIP